MTTSNSPLEPIAIIDVDNVTRPVVAYAPPITTQEWESTHHCHHKAQLLYSLRGTIHCQIQDGVWIVPPQCAVWIPSNLPHAARGSGETECYCLFIDPDVVPNLPKQCCTLEVSPLLRELIFKAVSFPMDYPQEGPEARLMATFIDELATANIENLRLPMPSDPRLQHLTDLMLADPTTKKSIAEWATQIGMSERNMTRLLQKEVGMSFGRWRRQLHVILALQWLSKGENVQTIALDLGYENASGFITMFRKAVGKPPARYFADHINASTKSAGEHIPTPPIILPDTI